MFNKRALLHLLSGIVAAFVGGAGLILGLPQEVPQLTGIPAFFFTGYFWLALVSGIVGVVRGALIYDGGRPVLPIRE